eukprot:673915_1
MFKHQLICMWLSSIVWILKMVIDVWLSILFYETLYKIPFIITICGAAILNFKYHWIWWTTIFSNNGNIQWKYAFILLLFPLTPIAHCIGYMVHYVRNNTTNPQTIMMIFYSQMLFQFMPQTIMHTIILLTTHTHHNEVQLLITSSIAVTFIGVVFSITWLYQSIHYEIFRFSVLCMLPLVFVVMIAFIFSLFRFVFVSCSCLFGKCQKLVFIIISVLIFVVGLILSAVAMQIMMFTHLVRVMTLNINYIDASYVQIMDFIYNTNNFNDDMDLYLRIIAINRAYLKQIYSNHKEHELNYSGLFQFVFKFDNGIIKCKDKWMVLQKSACDMRNNIVATNLIKNAFEYDITSIYIAEKHIKYMCDPAVYYFTKYGYGSTLIFYLLSRIAYFISPLAVIITADDIGFSFKWCVLYLFVLSELMVVIMTRTCHIIELHRLLSYIMVGYHSLKAQGNEGICVSFLDMESEYMELYTVPFANKLITNSYGHDVACVITSYLQVEYDPHIMIQMCQFLCNDSPANLLNLFLG